MKRLWLGGVFAAAIVGGVLWLNQDDGRPQTQLTINLGGAILREGGTVIVLPTPVTKEALAVRTENPKVLRRLSVDVSEVFSIVYFSYPEVGKWTFRFGTKSSDPEDRKVTTLRVDVGSGGYLETATRQWVELPHIDTLMVSGRNASEDDSRMHRVKLTELLRTRAIGCQDFEDARVCVPE